MDGNIVYTPLVFDSLQDRLREAESNDTVPLRDAYRQWKARAAERQSSPASVSPEQEPLTVAIGKVVAMAAAVAAAAAVYKSLSFQSPPLNLTNQVRDSLEETSSVDLPPVAKSSTPEPIVG